MQGAQARAHEALPLQRPRLAALERGSEALQRAGLAGRTHGEPQATPFRAPAAGRRACRGAVIAPSLAQVAHLELECVQGVVQSLTELIALARHDDLPASGVTGDTDLVSAAAMVLGRLADDPDIEKISVPLGRERLDPLLDLGPLLIAPTNPCGTSESAPFILHSTGLAARAHRSSRERGEAIASQHRSRGSRDRFCRRSCRGSCRCGGRRRRSRGLREPEPWSASRSESALSGDWAEMRARRLPPRDGHDEHSSGRARESPAPGHERFAPGARARS